MLFSNLSQKLDTIEATSARLEITAYLADLWRMLTPAEAGLTCYLLDGYLLPPYKGLEFSLSDKMIVRGLALLADEYGGFEEGVAIDIFGNQDMDFLLNRVRKIYRSNGDLGVTAQEVCQKLNTENKVDKLSITNVYDKLTEIALLSGEGSQDTKLVKLKELLKQVPPISAKYIVRIIVGRMRLGFSLMTILDSLSWSTIGSKEESGFLENIYQKKADLGMLATEYLEKRLMTSSERQTQLQKTYQVQVGVPVMPALCQRLNSAHEIIEKMNEVIAEPKYDGMRVQIHISSGEVKAFTRSLEDISHMYPELQCLAQVLPVQTIILDSETVGYDNKTNQLLPFQATITRRRKHNIEKHAQDLPVRFYIFDILYLDGKELLTKPLHERKQILAEHFAECPEATLTPYIVTNDPIQLKEYHENMLGDGLEGVVVKQIDSDYQSGRKGWQWVKIKEEEGTQGKLRDTLDLIVLGYYSGRGKRHSFGIGGFLTGLQNEKDEIVTISKIGTGITDEEFVDLKKIFDQVKTVAPPTNYKVDKSLTPHVWLEPKIVVEIAADEITKSTFHTSGFGLRFPRLVGIRSDKTIDNATKTSELKEIMSERG